MTSSMRRELAKLLPPEAFLPDSALGDWPPGSSPPVAVLAPFSETQVAQVMARASQEGWRVLPAGLCSWLDGGGTPDVDLVLSTRNLRELGSYESADLTFTAGAGIPWRGLQKETRANGQWLPLDPPGAGAGSLGAVAASGVSGPLRHAHGAPRDHILGVTLVSGDGRILNWGGRVVKNVAGFDITRLSIGSWGALGIITSVSARLFPLHEEDVTLLLSAPSAEDLLPVARSMATSPLPLSALELLDPLGPDGFGAAGRVGGEDRSGRGGREVPRAGVGGETGSWGVASASGGAALAMRLLGSKAQVREMELRIRKALGGEERKVFSGPGSLLELRSGESRSFHAAMEDWEKGAAMVLRLSLVPSRLGTLLEEVRELARRVGGSVREGLSGKTGGSSQGGGNGAFGGVRTAAHVGCGVLRVAFGRLPSAEGGLQELAQALGDLRSRLEGEGGSLRLSTAPRGLMDEVGAWGTLGPVEGLMEGLKREFDPAGILSPGRFGINVQSFPSHA